MGLTLEVLLYIEPIIMYYYGSTNYASKMYYGE